MRNEQQPWGMSVNRDVAGPPPTFGRRFLGGPPLAVLARLVLVSLVVGALLFWLQIEPLDILRDAVRAVERVWAMGFAALGDIGRYVLAGATIVVPVWFLMRLLTVRGTR